MPQRLRNVYCYFRARTCLTELILVLRNLYFYYGVYAGSEIPVGIAEITERVQVLRNCFLYGSTCKYYGTYTDLTEHILVLQNLDMYIISYTCLTEPILILRILYWYYRTYYCISDIEVPVDTTEHFNGTKVPVGATEQIPYTEVLVGTTGLVLIY